MIKYLSKIIKTSGLLLGDANKNCLIDITYNLFRKTYTYHKQIWKLDFLLYALFQTVSWIKLLHTTQSHIWIIIDETDLLCLKYIITAQNSFISEQAWIPGILSNSNIVYKGERFYKESETENIKIMSPVDIVFLYAIKNSAILQEFYNYLTPSIVTLIKSNISNFKCLVPIYVPVCTKFWPILQCNKKNKEFWKNIVDNNLGFYLYTKNYRYWFYYLLFFLINWNQSENK